MAGSCGWIWTATVDPLILLGESNGWQQGEGSFVFTAKGRSERS